MKDIAIFDIDNTIIQGQSQALFVQFLRKNGYMSFFYYISLMIWVIAYRLGLVSNPLRPMKYGLSFIRGKTINEADQILNKFFNTVMVKKIYPEVIKIINEHKKADRIIILVSNVPDVLVKKLADYLKIENYLSTVLEIKDGIYTGNIIGDIMYGEQKLNSIKMFVELHRLSFENSWGYGDHESDMFVLERVTHPYAVNPSKGLKVLSIRNNWPVLNFQI